ncbi:MAG: carboxypeptidase-like regulatory domain-containing protein [Candidatus Zixiibacteriota bacterium]
MAGFQSNSGFSLIELVVVIVVIGILAGVAMQSMTASVDDLRRTSTEREMDLLAKAIVGNPSLTQNGQRSDFGYVGDIGAFPPNLDALRTNPGGYGTWVGPYLAASYAQDATGFKLDAWGAPYSYAGGITITSTGSGTTLTEKIADATGDYLLNRINGTILDAANELPGATWADSIDITITFPDGTGGLATKTYHPNAAGQFTLDSIPVGQHPVRAVFQPETDTVIRYLTVLPRHRGTVAYRFSGAYFGGATATDTLTLRPDGAGSLTALTSSGCSSNYQCVQESSPDGDASIVIRASSSFATDVYALEDPAFGAGTIQEVTVYCRARRTQTLGQVMLVVYLGGTEYRGSTQDLTGSYAIYGESWATRPSGGQWTWTDITNLQAGIRLSGQNSNFPGYCTQVWVEVVYSN